MLTALSQESRLDIFKLLVRSGHSGMPAGKISETLDKVQNTVSSNLSILSNAGLVTSKREGRSIRYFANLDAMRDLLGFLMEDCCGGNPADCAPFLDEVICI
nr:metalloregulator ArsR/SmtB family transcription factor [Kordiimonas sp. SCSIO 12610]